MNKNLIDTITDLRHNKNRKENDKKTKHLSGTVIYRVTEKKPLDSAEVTESSTMKATILCKGFKKVNTCVSGKGCQYKVVSIYPYVCFAFCTQLSLRKPFDLFL